MLARQTTPLVYFKLPTFGCLYLVSLLVMAFLDLDSSVYAFLNQPIKIDSFFRMSAPASSSSSRFADPNNLYFASPVESTTTTTIENKEQIQIETPPNKISSSIPTTNSKTKKLLRRELGSQENLMLPRQYGPNPHVNFPSMNHVCCAILSSTPSEKALKVAINQVMKAHPLLRARIEGTGEPDKRIDLFQMVRQGDNNPCTFVIDDDNDDDEFIKIEQEHISIPNKKYSADDVLRIINIDGSNIVDIEKSWKAAFLRDLDDGSWCQVETTPLWKVELHRFNHSNIKGGSQDNKLPSRSALLLSFNHAISDQSSASRLVDQILTLVADYEARDDGALGRLPQSQEIPFSVEESVLGLDQRWKDIEASGIGLGTLRYIAGKALEETKSPVILPDGNLQSGGILSALSTITGKAAGGEDETSMDRKSVVTFRSLSKDTTKALLEKCRENGVSMTNALSAALTLTSTDFVSNANNKEKKSRNYKILQSLDMRRFGDALDKGESVGCLAGSMDLMHGPLEDRSGQRLRNNPTKKGLKFFWNLAKEGNLQTNEFIASGGPGHAVRVFDFAMTISDLNNLVHLTAQSKDSQGRAYSAGFTNAGVFEKLDAFSYQGEQDRELLQVSINKYFLA